LRIGSIAHSASATLRIGSGSIAHRSIGTTRIGSIARRRIAHRATASPGYSARDPASCARGRSVFRITRSAKPRWWAAV